MAENTKIEWADHTFNPWMGCTRVSPACDNCYAADMMDARYGRVKWGAGEPRVRTKDWRKPVKWNRDTPGAFVFCASLADVFDNEVSEEWRFDLFDLIADTPKLTWLLLTKRIGKAESPGGWHSAHSCRGWRGREGPKSIAGEQRYLYDHMQVEMLL